MEQRKQATKALVIDIEWVKQEAAKAPAFTERQRKALGQILSGVKLQAAA